MDEKLIKFKAIIDDAVGKGFLKKIEPTIFDLVGKGHLENPLSDILAFFCNPEECHGLKDLVFSALAEGVEEMNNTNNRCVITPPTREQHTENRKRVDLVFEGDDWIMGVEVKVNAQWNNPFESYRDFLKNSSMKQVFTIVFSPCCDTPDNLLPPGWSNVAFGTFTSKVKYKLKHEKIVKSKWVIFLEDFLQNIDNMEGKIKMEKEEAEFVSEHYKDILKIEKLKNEYENTYIVNLCRNTISDLPGFKIDKLLNNVKNWREYGVALIFESPELWGSTQELILLILPDGKYRIQFKIARENYEMNEKANIISVKNWNNGGFHIGDYDSLEQTLEKFKNTAKYLTEWNSAN